ncbi:LIC20153 family lipoprotein [Leptospira haakeii]|uniref:Lipoprotein n=1 Tax=Leptospira haakeii TaxID=2023198 RepID=A0ABX4PIY5_9LEPT|nr:hypothetical protein [Leptospira haakeii]PKA15580.1 hypothetical protein CH363_13330 [Leptospira haakeii]PKA18947.1 hypothetical protein CH377_15225 [Leptospira haakeii]
MKQKAIWLLLVLLLSASFVDCKKDDGEDLTNLALLNALSGGGDCLVDFPGKAAVGVNRTRVTKNTTGTSIVWGRIPFVNHPIAIVEILGIQNNDSVVFHGVDVIENPNVSGQPTIYASNDCPLAESDIINDGTTKFNISGSDPYTYASNNTSGNFYFLLYIVGSGNPPAATVDYNDL